MAVKDILATGPAATTDVAVQVVVVSSQKTWVHVLIVDEKSGEPAPVRIHFGDKVCRCTAPDGRRNEMNDNLFEDHGGI